jgi:fluoride exporter
VRDRRGDYHDAGGPAGLEPGVSTTTWLVVAVLGGCGAVARYVVDVLVGRWARSRFPFGTFVVNVAGSFALGVVVGAEAGSDIQLYAGSGFVGAFTTFSTWMLETERLVDDGRSDLAIANVAVQSVAGALAATGGFIVGSLAR